MAGVSELRKKLDGTRALGAIKAKLPSFRFPEPSELNNKDEFFKEFNLTDEKYASAKSQFDEAVLRNLDANPNCNATTPKRTARESRLAGLTHRTPRSSDRTSRSSTQGKASEDGSPTPRAPMSPFTFPDGTQGNTQDSLYRRTANPEAAASAPPSSEHASSLTIKPEQLAEEKLLQGNEVDAQEESNTGEAAVEYPDELDEFCVGEEDEDSVRRKLFPDNVTAKDEKTGKEKMTPAFERGMKFIEQQMLGNDGWLVPVIKNYASHMEEVDDLSSSPAEAMPATGESELQRNLALAESVKRVSGHWEKEFEKEIESNSHKKLLKKAKGKSKGLKYTAASMDRMANKRNHLYKSSSKTE
ncbi:hypothetical protein LTR46_001818 [Exophiala xenobiotica]|nr:hypothetical protein LTR46_001818 [Exophiala xenobiotica]